MKSLLSACTRVCFALFVGLLCAPQPAAAADAACATGQVLTDGLCYTPCRSGYTATVTMCVPGCPAGFRDDGLYCAKPAAYGRGAGYPWKFGDKAGSLDGARARCVKANPQGCEKSGAIIYPLCRSGFHNVGSNICSPSCPSGYTDIGVSCQKKTYDRGAGVIPPSVGGTCNVAYTAKFADGTPRRYDQMTWFTQHNAFANSDDGWDYAMSTFNIEKQLKGGVRALMLDAHDYDGKVMLCHDKCTGTVGGNYALPRKTLGDALKVVKSFLDKNTDQIVTVILESNIGDAKRIKAEIDTAGLSANVYDPKDDQDWKFADKGWPTIDWMVQKNRRFVMLSSKSSDEDSQVGAVYEWSYARQNTYDLGLLGTDLACKNGDDNNPINGEQMFVMNHFHELANLVAAAQDNRKDAIVDRFKNKCLSIVKRPPVFLAVNYYHHQYCGAADAVNELNKLWESYKK